jgi:hypothetical protein
LVEILNQIKGVDNIDRDDEASKSRIEVVLDFEKMARIDPHYWLKNPNPCLPHPELTPQLYDSRWQYIVTNCLVAF